MALDGHVSTSASNRSSFLFILEFGTGHAAGFPAPSKFRWQIPNWELVLIDDRWQLYLRERET